MQNVATLAATTYSTSDPNASASYGALNQRVYAALAVPAGVQSINDIEASLANAQTAMSAAQSQHQQTANTLTNMLQSIEGVNTTAGRRADPVAADEPVGVAVDDRAAVADQSAHLSRASHGRDSSALN